MAVDQGGLDVGATSWLLVSAALVLVMTPGVAFFYGGMVRAGNVLGTIMKSFIVIGIVSVVWVAVGFSLAFDKGNGFIGGLSRSPACRISTRWCPASIPAGCRCSRSSCSR